MSAGDDTSGRVVIVSSGSDDDARMRARLAKQLKPWARRERVEVWHEGLIMPGEALTEIDERLAEADAIVVLLTPDLLDEERLWGLAERSLTGEARVLPVHARSCGWQHTAFKDLGDTAGAKPLLEHAVAIAEKRLGAEHPHTRHFRNNLAQLVSQENKTSPT